MIVHDVTQGTKEWARLRAGIPTSSEFSRIMTPTGKPSRSQEPYRNHLIAERMLGRPLDAEVITLPMERGSRMESEAVAYYEFQQGAATVEVGFVTDDNRRFGTSPDRLVGDDGLLEIKCPSAETHVGYLFLRPASDKYRPQLQGQLWITGRQWVDIMSYYPGLPEALVRVERDEEYIKKLAKAVTNFSEWLEESYIKLCEEIRPTETRTLDPLELQREDVMA